MLDMTQRLYTRKKRRTPAMMDGTLNPVPENDELHKSLPSERHDTTQ